MSDRPAISIVTPTRNRRGTLERALASVRRQTVGDYEHIIVDDASSDGSADFCSRFGDSRVRVHRFDVRQGANEARNRGLAMARAPIVTFLDSDDEFLPHRLEHTLAILATDPHTDLVLGSFRVERAGSVSESVNRDARLDGPELESLLMWHAVYLGGTSITLRRSVAIACGGYAPSLARMQDREFLLNLANRHRPHRHGGWARISDTVDWTKHESEDSISRPVTGYVTALGDLMGVHPDLLRRHRLAVQYHVARHLKDQLRAGRWWVAGRVVAENSRVPAFRFPLPTLLAAYRQGRVIRRRMLRVGMSGTDPIDLRPTDLLPAALTIDASRERHVPARQAI
jgi:glycosyltransferase involved in cell wall biosynthesis